jgi:N-ethylmaleimide reductase
MTMTLFTPIAVGGLFLENRVVMAPMTRSRAVGGLPNSLMGLSSVTAPRKDDQS